MNCSKSTNLIPVCKVLSPRLAPFPDPGELPASDDHAAPNHDQGHGHLEAQRDQQVKVRVFHVIKGEAF